jgi:predicted peptidase
LQKPIVDNRRVNSVERHPAPAVIRSKLPTTVSNTSTNSNHQRLGKFSLDIFQPQSKSNISTHVANKKSITINNKTKTSTKMSTPKVKLNSSIPDEENIQPNK